MNLQLSVSSSPEQKAATGILSLANGKNVYLNANEANFHFKVGGDKDIYIFGEVFYFWKLSDDSIKSGLTNDDLSRLFSQHKLTEIIPLLEGQYVGVEADKSAKKITVFSDRYAREDCFYLAGNGELFLGADLDFVINKRAVQYDSAMVAHMFMVYGWYVPKGHTIYKNVKRLRVGEILEISDKGLSSSTIPFKPQEIDEYKELDLERYYKILRESVLARANKKGKVWLSSSSGWDSTMLVGLLAQELGANNVGMITGVMKFSKQTDVINQFEIDKISKIASFYKIKPEFVDYDYKEAGAFKVWEKFLPHYRARHMYVYTSYSMQKLSDQVACLAGPGQVLFNGEASDSFHNFGFSQFATFFHTDKNFTEYADKMNCYLYGPSFLRKVQNKTFTKDKVYDIFKRMLPHVAFDDAHQDPKDLLESYLIPMFYGSVRVPFANNMSNPALNTAGMQQIRHFPYRQYMPETLATMNDKNIYAWLIYLYHSFHTQGSTVNSRKCAAKYNNHGWRSPYNDYRMVDILSKAPESWGRGLDLNHTKFPLKWVAKNKINFPYELLASGPHSYLYDVVEGFSLYAELTYRSGVAAHFKERLAARKYRDLCHSDYFDTKYLDRLVDDYVAGKEAAGKDFNNLVTLITLSTTGWY